MALTTTTWCDFVIWTPHGTHVERINFDTEHWNAVKPKLRDFYFKAVLPELASLKQPDRTSESLVSQHRHNFIHTVYNNSI